MLDYIAVGRKTKCVDAIEVALAYKNQKNLGKLHDLQNKHSSQSLTCQHVSLRPADRQQNLLHGGICHRPADSPVVSSSMTDDKPTLTPLMQLPSIMPNVGMKY